MINEEFKLPELEVVEINTEKENLLDYMWLFNNIPWSNHTGKIGKVILSEPAELYIIKMDGYDTKSSFVSSFKFDNVEIIAMHGFGGNSFNFDFRLGDEKVEQLSDYERMAFSKEDLKEKFIAQLNRKIKGLKWQINYAKIAIDNVKKL